MAAHHNSKTRSSDFYTTMLMSLVIFLCCESFVHPNCCIHNLLYQRHKGVTFAGCQDVCAGDWDNWSVFYISLSFLLFVAISLLVPIWVPCFCSFFSFCLSTRFSFAASRRQHLSV